MSDCDGSPQSIKNRDFTRKVLGNKDLVDTFADLRKHFFRPDSANY